MPREKDTRDYSARREPPTGRGERATPGIDERPGFAPRRRNAVTGTPRSLDTEGAGGSDDYVASALAQVRSQFARQLDFAATETPEFVPDPQIQRTSRGTTIVHLHQQYHGIPIFEMARSVQFGPDHKVERIVGDNVAVTGPLMTAPVMTAGEALLAAGRYIADHDEDEQADAWGQKSVAPSLELPAGYEPKVVSTFDRPSRPTVLERGPFGQEAEASLVFFYTGSTLRLSWKLLVTLPDLSERYLLIVAADRPLASFSSNDDTVLLCQRTTTRIAAHVFLHNPGAGARVMIDLPVGASTYPLNGTRTLLPNPFPPAWWVDDDETIGNCAAVVHAASASPFSGTGTGNGVTFDPATADGEEQQMVNAFFFCNYMHDFFYLLGFDEKAGNFQKINFTDGGSANDAVDTRVHARVIPKTARFDTPQDGRPPSLNLGFVELPNGDRRHTALDADVVFHEYVHGVTNRLVGGRMDGLALQQPQSRAMGEGWSDYFAVTIQGHRAVANKVVLADWTTGRDKGIRSAPYDEHYPNTYGRVGAAPFTSEHQIGEIWCAALVQMNRQLDAALGAPRGHQLGWQVVVDGLKLTPANPSFIDARDAILKALADFHRDRALDDGDYQKARRAAWAAFAQFGVGPGAQSNGASLTGIVEDKTVPADL